MECPACHKEGETRIKTHPHQGGLIVQEYVRCPYCKKPIFEMVDFREGKMTKQEKIRKGVADILKKSMSVKVSATIHGEEKEYFFPRGVDEVMEYLHSQGVVLKVDRELPRLVKGEDPSLYTWKEGQESLIKSGYEAVESLIEESMKYAIARIYDIDEDGNEIHK